MDFVDDEDRAVPRPGVEGKVSPLAVTTMILNNQPIDTAFLDYFLRGARGRCKHEMLTRWEYLNYSFKLEMKRVQAGGRKRVTFLDGRSYTGSFMYYYLRIFVALDHGKRGRQNTLLDELLVRDA